MNYMAAVSERGWYDDMAVQFSKIFTMGTMLSSPVVQDGVVYVGSTDGNLYGLK